MEIGGDKKNHKQRNTVAKIINFESMIVISLKQSMNKKKLSKCISRALPFFYFT